MSDMVELLVLKNNGDYLRRTDGHYDASALHRATVWTLSQRRMADAALDEARTTHPAARLVKLVVHEEELA